MNNFANHNGMMGGHVGVEKTVERIQKDWYWPGMHEAVDRWCATCDLCKGEHGTTGISVWTRTELYSRPFGVIQFDTVECAPAVKTSVLRHEVMYIFTAMCCFSRWV